MNFTQAITVWVFELRHVLGPRGAFGILVLGSVCTLLGGIVAGIIDGTDRRHR